MGSIRFKSLAAATTVGLLTMTACGDDADSADGGEATEEGAVELRFAWWGSAERAELTEEAIDAFEEESEHSASGEYTDFSGYFDRLATSVAGGDAPDVFTLGGAYPAEYANRDALLDLSTVSDHLDLGPIDNAALQNGQINGTQYALSAGSNAVSVIVNTEVFEQADVELPDPQTWTWDEYVEIAEELANNTPDDVYGTDSIITHDTIDVYARQNGEVLYTEDGEIGVSEATLTEFFTFAQNLEESGAGPNASLVTELDGASPEQTLLGTGQAGMMINWSNQLLTLAEAAGSELEIWPLPEEAETPGVWQQSSQFYAISADSENPDAAGELLDFLVNSEEAVQILGLDRGVPDNAEMRDAIADSLEGYEQAEVDYIEDVSSRDTAPRFIGPTGSTTVEEITVRIENALLRDASPEEAAAQWIEQAEAAVEG